MTLKPDHAFILAAGMGTRLRPYTDNCPKPMVEIGGRPIIDQVLDRLQEAGVTDVTVNLHYMAGMMETHLRQRSAPRLTFSHETALLDTGGGVKNALGTMGRNPFFITAGDSVWTDGPPGAALDRMVAAWDPAKMDMLLLLQPLTHMTLTEGRGDYDVLPDGRAVRSRDKSGVAMWTSVRLCKPSLFDDTPDGPFSFLTLMDRAEAQGKLYALMHDGDWHHISTPSDLERVNAAIAAQNPRDRAQGL
jgi:MurNAc alpha-1-phosphate uridylyltransferase